MSDRISAAAQIERLRAAWAGRRAGWEPPAGDPPDTACWCCGASCPVAFSDPPAIWRCRACDVTWMDLDWISERWEGVRYGPGPHP